jgi:hypothetical protein
MEEDRMRRLICRILPLLLLAAIAGAADDKKSKSDQPKSPAEKFRALNGEIEKATQAAAKSYREAKTPEEQQKVEGEFRKKVQGYAGRFLKLGEDNPKEDFAGEALVFVVINGSGAESDRAIDLLMKDHADKLPQLCGALGQEPTPGGEKMLRTLMAKSKDHPLAGQAMLTLAQLLKMKSAGNEAGPLAKEAEELFERVSKDFADVKSLKETADGELFEIRNLAIGKTAPETSGEDGDGKKFQLADYRGKVVLLDFWAGW